MGFTIYIQDPQEFWVRDHVRSPFLDPYCGFDILGMHPVRVLFNDDPGDGIAEDGWTTIGFPGLQNQGDLEGSHAASDKPVAIVFIQPIHFPFRISVSEPDPAVVLHGILECVDDLRGAGVPVIRPGRLSDFSELNPRGTGPLDDVRSGVRCLATNVFHEFFFHSWAVDWAIWVQTNLNAAIRLGLYAGLSFWMNSTNSCAVPEKHPQKNRTPSGIATAVRSLPEIP